MRPGRYALELGMQVQPARASDQVGASRATTGAVSALELLATIGLWSRMDLSAGITAANARPGDSKSSATAAAALGDVRLVPRLRLAGADSGAGLAIALPLWWPAGNASVSRDLGLRIEPRALLSYLSKRVTLSANGGYRFRQPNETRPGWSDALTASVGAELPVLFTWSVLTELASRLQLHHVDADGGTRLPVEARAAVRFSTDSWGVQLGGGAALQRGAAEPDWRLFASVAFQPPVFEHGRPSAPPSARVPEDFDPCADDTGSGCSPEPDEPAQLAAEEPPEVERERPRTENLVQRQPEQPLPRIREILYFDLNTMNLTLAQRGVLDQVESQLRSAPEDAELMIEGHSDSFGPPSFNSALSLMRASTARFYLIQRGISWRRLQMVGYGSARPIELDVDERGRARNRRVEFRLIRKPQR